MILLAKGLKAVVIMTRQFLNYAGMQARWFAALQTVRQ
jgi:hypothetical protein